MEQHRSENANGQSAGELDRDKLAKSLQTCIRGFILDNYSINFYFEPIPPPPPVTVKHVVDLAASFNCEVAPSMTSIIANYLYLDGTVVIEEIIGVGGGGIVVKRGGYAFKIPRISKVIEIDGVPFDDGRLTPNEGDYDERAAAIRAFKNEKAIYRRLGDHPGIIRCYNLASDDPSIQMPLMKGDLRHHLAGIRPGRATQLSWLLQLAHTLAYVHSRRVLICDIRLDNVVLDDNKSVKLIDFSESSLMPLDWDLNGCDDAGFSTFTDIGQFGALIFELTTGQRCSFDIYQDWKDVGDPTTWPRRETLPSTTGLWLGSIMEKCWTKGFLSAQDLEEELEKEGFSQWWAALPPAETERRVLSFIPYLQKHVDSTPTSPHPGTEIVTGNHETDTAKGLSNPATDPYGPRTWRSRMVRLSGKDRALNEFSVERPEDKKEQNLVIIHGYGAGLGFFYKNFEPLSRAKGWQLYALDLLGMGRSSRPPFRIQAKTREEQISEAEDWFVDALEEWRAARKIDKMTLLGHSMGGYMAVCYALKYPGRLNKLILASPVGIPEDPSASQAEMPKPPDVDNGETEIRLRERADGKPRRPLPKWFAYLWDANISPFSFVRLSGPLGPRLVSGWTSRRFSHLPEDEARALHDYAYSLFRLPGSGEYALAYILAPGAFARSPLIRRIHGLGRQTLANGEPEKGLPVVFMYGQHDWMDVNGGLAAKTKIDAMRDKLLEPQSAAERADDRGSAKVVVIPEAGHHLYLDNPGEFNKVLIEELDDISRNAVH
ncbi:hypothetical protein DV738_g3041, partial [Chaetothyriales sp. CBS 135597]